MNLNEYFKKQNCKLCDEQKLLIYDEIKEHIGKQSIFSKVSFYVKVAMYSFILLFLFSGLFFNFQSKKNITENVVVEKNIQPNIVKADYIAKVIQSKWDFQIFDNNKLLKTNVLWNGNTIVLKDNSYVKLSINQWAKAYLLWPAKIKIKKYKNTYILNVIEWDYITVKSNSNEDKIIIKSKLLNIEQKGKNIDIKYQDKDGVKIVENNGAVVLVENKWKSINLKEKEKLILLDAKEQKYIENLLSDDYKNYQLNNGKLKIILSVWELQAIDNILSREYTMLSVGKYVLWKVNHNQGLENKWKKELINNIIKLYDLLEIKVNIDKTNLSNDYLKQLLTNLINEINQKYVLPDTYLMRLKVMLSYVVILEKINLNQWRKFSSLSDFVNSLKLDKKYKKILLQF